MSFLRDLQVLPPLTNAVLRDHTYSCALSSKNATDPKRIAEKMIEDKQIAGGGGSAVFEEVNNPGEFIDFTQSFYLNENTASFYFYVHFIFKCHITKFNVFFK